MRSFKGDPEVKKIICLLVQLVLKNVLQISFSCSELPGRLREISAELLFSQTLNTLSPIYRTFVLQILNKKSAVSPYLAQIDSDEKVL